MKVSLTATAVLAVNEEMSAERELRAMNMDKHNLKRLTKLNKRWRNHKNGKLKQVPKS